MVKVSYVNEFGQVTVTKFSALSSASSYIRTNEIKHFLIMPVDLIIDMILITKLLIAETNEIQEEKLPQREKPQK